MRTDPHRPWRASEIAKGLGLPHHRGLTRELGRWVKEGILCRTALPAGRASLEQAWDAFTPFLAFIPAVRKLLYTTNAIESLNYQLRKVTKARGHFPNDDAVVKLLWLAIINIEDKRARERLARRQQTGKRTSRPPRRRAARHGLARGTERARHGLPRTLR
jgi:transposase-like protein